MLNKFCVKLLANRYISIFRQNVRSSTLKTDTINNLNCQSTHPLPHARFRW